MNTNIVIISGRITRDLELKQSKISNNKYCSSSIAVDMGKDQKGNKKTAFIPFTIWENNAEYLTKYAEKGSRIVLTGYMDQNKTYNHEKNCNEYELVFKPRQVEIIDWKKKEEKTNTEIVREVMEEEDPFAAFAQETEITDEDLPF